MEYTNRQKKIISLLSNEDTYVTGKMLSILLDVSIRTIQSEIALINQHSQLILATKKGYTIHPNKKDDLSIIDIHQNKDHTILKQLIFFNEPLQIDEFAESLYMSTSSLEKRLKDFQSILEQYNLSINRNKSYISIIGKELDKRKFINYLIFEETGPAFNNLDNISSYFKGINISKVRSIILNTLNKYGYYVENNYISNLLINIIIALYRMRDDSYIEYIQNDSVHIAMPEYHIAEDICNQYSNHWNINPTINDIKYIAIILWGQIKPINHSISSNNPTSEIMTTEFIHEMDEILFSVFSYYMLNIDFSNFLYNFALHIDALIKRASNCQIAHNDIFDSIKRNCPFIYDVAVHIAKKISDKYHISIGDEEIGYISIHIGFLIETHNTLHEKMKILLICDDYYHITEKMINNIMKDHADDIIIQSTKSNISAYELDDKIDFIITTKNLSFIGKKTIHISPFYTQEDYIKINDAVNKCIIEREKRNQNEMLRSYFHQDLFFHTNNYSTKKDAIRFMGQKIIDFGLAKEGFIESVFKREEMSSTCFFDTFAIPHAIELNAKQTMFCVLISTNGIIWDDKKIHIILMIAVQQKDRKKFMKIYESIIKTLWDKEKVFHLIKAESLNEFIKRLER
ncbi:BglG family transcription antiterminator [Candidatus Stoquefichus massiliensis]|uniref:BglG family transcription antiterminator n=1 Tax=Candidatus Stoquefichus massiliensis TaxID=1470350 RepID=UPI00047F4FC0|nr:PTS sugar transporter subunit IIA [Candidatus Stoquefichus massiliensis]